MTTPSFPAFDDVFTVQGDYRNITSPVALGSTNVASVQILTGFVDLIPRVPAGFMFYKTWQVEGQNAIQTLGFGDPQTGGTFTPSFNGHAVASAIASTASAATVQTALQAVTGIGSGNVLVTADPNVNGWDVEFTGSLANTDVPLMTVTSSGTTGDAEVGLIEDGVVAVSRETAFALDTYYQSRIWTNGQLSSINTVDSESIQLPANTADISDLLGADLIYDVRFRNIVFAQSQRDLANFAFAAQDVGGTVTLTDPGLSRLPYAPLGNIPILP